MKPDTDMIADAREIRGELSQDDPEIKRYQEFEDTYYRAQQRDDIPLAISSLLQINEWCEFNRHRAGIKNDSRNQNPD